MNSCYMLLVVSTGQGVYFRIWAPNAFCPASLLRERQVNKMNRFRKTECKSLCLLCKVCDCMQTNYLSLSSSESHRLILPFLRRVWFLKVFLWGRVEKNIRPGPKLCCDLSVAPHEGRLATERGTSPLCSLPDKRTSVSIAGIKTLMALVHFIH